MPESVSINTAGYAFGTPIANLIFDVSGTYKPMLFLTALLMLMIAVSFCFIMNAADRVRSQVMLRANSDNTLEEGE